MRLFLLLLLLRVLVWELFKGWGEKKGRKNAVGGGERWNDPRGGGEGG